VSGNIGIGELSMDIGRGPSVMESDTKGPFAYDISEKFYVHVVSLSFVLIPVPIVVNILIL
jgi:hypothetical protein